jgi:hypothetical protein
LDSISDTCSLYYLIISHFFDFFMFSFKLRHLTHQYLRCTFYVYIYMSCIYIGV